MPANVLDNFEKFEQQVTSYAQSAIKFYFGHKCFASLENRKKKLDDSIDMGFNSAENSGDRIQNAWRSNIAIPMVREAFLTRQAVLSAAFSQNDLITVEPDGNTPHSNATNMNDVVISVLRNTHYTENTLEPIIDSCSRYGTGVVVSYFDIRKYKKTKTVPSYINGVFDGSKKEKVEISKEAVYCDPISILHYFQQPDQPDPKKALYRGYVERVPLHTIKNESIDNEDDIWIKKNIEELLANAEKGDVLSAHYSQGKSDEKPEMIMIDRYHFYGKLPFKGNRDDDTTYYLQIAGDKVIRFQENPHDEDTIPIDIFTLYKRPEYWWGNTDAENVVPMENYMQMILSMYADSALQELQRYIFYDTSTGIDPATINEKAKNGGWIPFDRKQGQNLKEIFHQYQFPGINTSNINYIVNETKEAAQRVRPKADFSRQENQGGLKNKTASAANIINQQANTLESFPLRMFSYGLQSNIRTMIILLQQNLSDYITARPKPSQNPVKLMKKQLMGEYNPVVSTCLTQTQAERAQRLLNFITAVQNFKGSGDPSWIRLQLHDVIGEWVKSILENTVDVEKVNPPLSPQEEMMMYQRNMMQAPQFMPQQQQGVMANAG